VLFLNSGINKGSFLISIFYCTLRSRWNITAFPKRLCQHLKVGLGHRHIWCFKVMRKFIYLFSIRAFDLLKFDQ
jgi:hypothetical protein